ncbi:MAG: hypothetical protein PUI86_03350 [Bacteroidales bacterium]|nr:hypothetical protein [Bacteroidales bacterium]MDD6921406.1 hypothetical protein [Bacteroidales bacterium]
METTIKCQNIELPADVMDKLADMALQSGKTLKAYIESVLTGKVRGNGISPSNDPWFDDEENLNLLKRGINDIQSGNSRIYSVPEIKMLLGL